MSSLAELQFTSEQYLALERNAETRSEFLRGRIYAMSGASRAHNLITVNVVVELATQLKGRPCEIYSGDMRVKVDATGLYTYPDVVVVCGDARLEDTHNDTLLNPTVIFEVLSPSTEAYDRGEKFDHYRRAETLTDYVMIAQERQRVEHYARQPDSKWLLTVLEDSESALHLPSISCSLPLAEVYSRIEFAREGEGARPI